MTDLIAIKITGATVLALGVSGLELARRHVILATPDGITVSGVWVLATLTSAGGVIALLFRLLITAKDKEVAALLKDKERERLELDSLKKSYQQIAAEALRSATETANYYLKKEGKPPVIMVAPVISESHSPSTARQRETALVATMRASMAAVKQATNQVPRTEPEHAVEKPNP